MREMFVRKKPDGKDFTIYLKEFVNGYYSFETQNGILRSLQKLNRVYIENGILKAEQCKKVQKSNLTQHF